MTLTSHTGKPDDAAIDALKTIFFLFLPTILTFMVQVILRSNWSDIVSNFPILIRPIVSRTLVIQGLFMPVCISVLIFLIAPTRWRIRAAIGGPIGVALLSVWLGVFEYWRLDGFVQARQTRWPDAWQYLDLVLTFGSPIALLCALTVLPFAWLKPTAKAEQQRVPDGIWGNADWMSMPEVTETFPSDGKIVVGERYRVDLDETTKVFKPHKQQTWGSGGKNPLLTFNFDFGSGHMIFFSGSGGFKTSSNVIPTCLLYTGPIVCLDPSSEVAPVVLDQRKRLRRKCFILDPKDPKTGFNVLDWVLRLGRDGDKQDALISIGRMLLSDQKVGHNATSHFFINNAHNLMTGFLAHIVFSEEFDGKRTLRTLREFISQPQPKVLESLCHIQQTSPHKFLQETLGVFTNMTEATFSGVYSTASSDTQWLSADNYSPMVCGGSFDTSELAAGKIDVFLNLPSEKLREYPGIGRVIVGALMNAMKEADGRHVRETLFVLDEADLLGYMGVLEEMRDRARKYGSSLMLFYQSPGQIKEHFGGAGFTSWMDGCSFVSFSCIQDLEVAKYISEKAGSFTVKVESSSKGNGRSTENTSTQPCNLISASDICTRMREDDQIIFPRSRPPIRCGRAMYFRRPEMVAIAGHNRFVRDRSKKI